MKQSFLFIIFLLSSILVFSQNFRLQVNYYQNSCANQREYANGESRLLWSLTTTQATLYYGSNNMPIENYKIIESGYDNQNNIYNYSFYDSKRDKYGVIVYFKERNYLSMQYLNTKCSLDYVFY